MSEASGTGRRGVTSEVGQLRTVLLHRPGEELRRLTPRNNDDLLFDGLPWVARAQEEHDAFAAALRARGVEVLYLRELLVEALAVPAARAEVIDSAVAPWRVGPSLAGQLHGWLDSLAPTELASVVTAGLQFDELPIREGVVARIAHHHEFVVHPLPNLMFTRDSSVWIGPQVAVTRPSMPARRREVTITGSIYRHHPRFAGVELLYEGDTVDQAWVEGGDVLVMAPGVIAIGVGQRTTPAGVEHLAANVFARGLAHTVLAVPIAQERATMHLDTVCTMVSRDMVVMYPPLADSLEAFVVTAPDGPGPLRVTGPEPFLAAAAKAMSIDTLRVIDTGLDPVTAEREQWDDGNNTLAVSPGVVVAYERNTETNRSLEQAGIEVIPIAGSELGSGRGGPRCMSCPIERAPIE